MRRVRLCALHSHLLNLVLSFQVRLAIAEKALTCEEHDVNLPLSEHNEPWFMRLNASGEVPVLIHGENIICEATQIIDYLEATFVDGNPIGILVCCLSHVYKCRSVASEPDLYHFVLFFMAKSL